MSVPKRPEGVCKDCWAVWANEPGRPAWRPAPHPGPRCASHHKAVQKHRKAAAHEKRVQAVYGLAPGQYAALLEAQGGRCALCRRANGRTKRLAVDHDHATGFVRGLTCGPCNSALAHFRDDPDAFGRAMNYLTIPPAWAVIGKVKPVADS